MNLCITFISYIFCVCICEIFICFRYEDHPSQPINGTQQSEQTQIEAKKDK